MEKYRSKKLIQFKKDLWYNLIRQKGHNNERRLEASIYYKNVRKKNWEKIKYDI
jgi:hypothetical protein